MAQISETYSGAGVNISLAAKAKELIARHARSTFRPEVLGTAGFFGGLFEFKGFRQPVLVSSVDGVGTKLKIASALDKHDTVGIDLVNHCVNDILTCGASPLFFLDYIAVGKMVPEQVVVVVEGLARACREVDCALIGGETAEMPGLYAIGDYDLAGFIVGVVEKENILNGEKIAAGDIVLGLPSSGLHTNGYSLVRKIFPVERWKEHYPELGRTLGEELLEPHRCYYHQLKPVLPMVKGMAHITGGGLVDNVPRVLPAGLRARFDRKSWEEPPIFRLLQREGKVARDEMYHVFNMGIGMAVVSAKNDVDRLTAKLPGARVIGEIVKGEGQPRVIIE